MRRTFERGSSPRRNNGRWSSPSFQTPKRRVGRGTSTFNQLQTRNINRRFSPVPHLPRWRRMDGQSSSSYERWSSVKSHGRLSSCNRSNERRSSPRSCHRQHSPETTHKRKRSSSTEKVLKEILDDPGLNLKNAKSILLPKHSVLCLLVYSIYSYSSTVT